MNAQCSATQLEFHDLGRRKVVGKFDGGEIGSDGGGVLPREVEKRTHILRRLSRCFTDYRKPDRIRHSVGTLAEDMERAKTRYESTG